MKKLTILFWLILLSSIASFLYIDYIGKEFGTILQKYVNTEVKRFTTNVVNTAVNDVVATWDTNDLFIIKKNEHQEVETIDFNTRNVNKILKEINKVILTRIQNLEMGKTDNLQVSEIFKKGNYKKIKSGVLCEIPLNALRKNVTLSNIGPTIPIKLSFSGNVKTTTKTSIESYGINNLVIEVMIIVKVNEQITMPTSSKETTITIESPLVLKIIQGKIPEYYETDLNGNSITSTIFQSSY